MNKQTKSLLIVSLVTALLIGISFSNRWAIQPFCPNIARCDANMLFWVLYPASCLILSIPAALVLRRLGIANAVWIAGLAAVEAYFIASVFLVPIVAHQMPYELWLALMGLILIGLYFVLYRFFNNEKSESPLAFKILIAATVVGVTAFVADRIVVMGILG